MKKVKIGPIRIKREGTRIDTWKGVPIIKTRNNTTSFEEIELDVYEDFKIQRHNYSQLCKEMLVMYYKKQRNMKNVYVVADDSIDYRMYLMTGNFIEIWGPNGKLSIVKNLEVQKDQSLSLRDLVSGFEESIGYLELPHYHCALVTKVASEDVVLIFGLGD